MNKVGSVNIPKIVKNPINKFYKDVADGFHRLAILAALGKTKIRVCKLEYKYNIFLRIFRKLYK